MGIKYSVGEKFFDVWTNEMTYVLGFLFADGSLKDAAYIRGKYVRVTSTDHDRILIIRKLLSSSHSIVKTEKGGDRKPRYLLRIGSHTLYERLVALGVTPRKSFTMKLPNVPAENLASFVRGYFARDSLRLFHFMYPTGISPDLLMQRKYAIFMRYFDEVRGNPDHRMSKYIGDKGPMVKG